MRLDLPEILEQVDEHYHDILHALGSIQHLIEDQATELEDPEDIETVVNYVFSRKQSIAREVKECM